MMTPQEVYEFVSNRECPYFPDKCSEEHFWNCPDCGKQESGNCSIVKLNHIDGGWACEACFDKSLEKVFENILKGASNYDGHRNRYE